MEYIGNKTFWDEKFQNRGERILDPEQSLIDNIGYFNKGTVLDIACGDGRNALFLLRHGFKVTGIDFSEKALERLRCFAQKNNLTVITKQIDLTKDSSLNNIGIFDNILINHYRLGNAQLKELKNHITDGGIVFVSGFGEEHKVDSRIKKEDLIQSTDFEEIYESFDLIKRDSRQDERGYFVTYILKRK
ncbi:class I SAM-dependent methyltransferase [Alkaliphilus metalliredigens]|nr:class I SAM-dependent methyltransferase [Alkaliphilus metalliredigens]